MASSSNEISTYFERCRCCLNYGYLKNMWQDHFREGEKEIYVVMLVQCFGLSWEAKDNSPKNDWICEVCISRLREACDFKKLVLQSQVKLEHIDEGSDIDRKIEKFDSSLEDQQLEIEDAADDESVDSCYVDVDKPECEDPDDPDYEDIDDPDYVNLVKPDYVEHYETEYLEEDEPNDMEYENIEYLEDEDSEIQTSQQTRRIARRPRKSDTSTGGRKWPKKLPKSERYKTYKQYTEEELRECLAAVRQDKLSTKEAAEKYNIPQKTIAAKLRQEPKDKEDQELKRVKKEKQLQLVKEIKLILKFTNATPYKSKANRFYCPYCSTKEHLYYEDPDELRLHVRTKHVADRIRKIDHIMRPYRIGETIKLDINNLICSMCCVDIPHWNDMFKHLKEKHDIVLDEAYTKVIPYDLSFDSKCALCEQHFASYMRLNSHMNAHYDNYVCPECGDTFLAEERLQKHVETHGVTEYQCSFCPKVYTLLKYKTKHEARVHHKLPKLKCIHCGERFLADYAKHLHLIEKHNKKPKVISCEFCDKTFTWRPYYIKHRRNNHEGDPRKHVCPQCGKKFHNRKDWKKHLLTHTVVKVKPFPCTICGNTYSTADSLRHHKRKHKKLLRDSDVAEQSNFVDTKTVFEIPVI